MSTSAKRFLVTLSVLGVVAISAWVLLVKQVSDETPKPTPVATPPVAAVKKSRAQLVSRTPRVSTENELRARIDELEALVSINTSNSHELAKLVSKNTSDLNELLVLLSDFGDR